MRVKEQIVYLTDNGAAYCGAHLGITARMTGHDLSGQAILPVTPEVLAEAGYPISCEHCGRLASRFHVS